MTEPDSTTYLAIYRQIGRVLDPYTQTVLKALIPILINKEPTTMADITQALADLGSAVQGVSDRTASDVADLKAEIETLKAAGVNVEQLQTIADSIEGQVTKLNEIDPVADVPTEPAPADPAPADPTPVDPAPADPAAPTA